MQENRCIFVSIPPSLPIDQFSSTVSHPTFPCGHCIFYGMVSNSQYATLSRGIIVEYPTRHLYFLVYTRVCIPENTSESWDISRYTTRKRCITSTCMNLVTEWIEYQSSSKIALTIILIPRWTTSVFTHARVYPPVSTNLFALFKSEHACWQQWQDDLQDGRKKRRRQVPHFVQDLRHHSQKPLLFLQRNNTGEICSGGNDQAWIICCSYNCK